LVKPGKRQLEADSPPQDSQGQDPDAADSIAQIQVLAPAGIPDEAIIEIEIDR
jgi:hypothetical protein